MDPETENHQEDWPSFRGLLSVQTLNALNDNVVKFLLIGVALNLGIVWAVPGSGYAMPFQHVLGALAALTFIVFSPLAGWFSDRYSKAGVIVSCMWLQLLCFLIIAGSLYAEWIWGAVIGFVLISIQSVIFSPAKVGIVKELLGSSRLGAAAGWMQMWVIVAIIAGSALGGSVYDGLTGSLGPWSAAAAPMAALFVVSIAAVIVSRRIRRTPAHDPKPFSPAILTKQFHYFAELCAEKRQRRSALGKAYFWGVGMFILLVVTEKADQIAGGTSEAGRIAGQMMAWMGLGVAIGGAFTAAVSKRRIQLGIVPIGGAFFALSMAVLPWAGEPGEWLYIAVLFVLGFAGSCFLTPLNAYLQDVCTPTRRGRMLAASALLDALANLGAVGVQLALRDGLNLSINAQLLVAAVATGLVTLYTMRLLPLDTLKALVLPVVRVVYGVRSHHPDNVPANGPVLLTANHVSYVDAFIVMAACHRPVRFLMLKSYYDMWWANWAFRIGGAIPIDTSKNASAAIKACVDALNNDEVVCIFPEGKLTRHGGMNEFKRGMEIIAKRSGAKVVPVALAGLYGSFFSHWGKGMMKGRSKRFPLKVDVTFAQLLNADDARAADVQQTIQRMLDEGGREG
ncbi:MFS transporter [Sulfuriroseicoccus oceanibius]|uniref:MFS transporter n=1 Tax=Sulfuriroseicoccus oceanibius TaxID=2707525 RepID=A0A6B3LD69_9BACT|nr:MFS transporter [Sulfuriroseicoccus oceanibius]QQL44890.1 MFS transporter [Sulfuriroseicoccus oceanibius]